MMYFNPKRKDFVTIPEAVKECSFVFLAIKTEIGGVFVNLS